MYMLADKDDKILTMHGKAVGFNSKNDALKVIPLYLKDDLKLVWKPLHDDDEVLTPELFEKWFYGGGTPEENR